MPDTDKYAGPPDVVLMRWDRDLLTKYITRDEAGNRLDLALGEPDADGFYVATVTVNYEDNILAAANARADEAEAMCDCWQAKALGYETAMFLAARLGGREWEPGQALGHILTLKRQMNAADRMYDILSHSAGANEVTIEYAAAREAVHHE